MLYNPPDQLLARDGLSFISLYDARQCSTAVFLHVYAHRSIYRCSRQTSRRSSDMHATTGATSYKYNVILKALLEEQ
jgi:hypothetical protein